MDLGPLLDALQTARPGNVGVREWSVFASETRSLGLGVKDREVANPHAPVNLNESCGARYRLVWHDGLLSRGYVERRQLESDSAGALRQARAAAYEDPDAAWVLGPQSMPEVETRDVRAAAMADGDTELLGARLATVRRRIAAFDARTWSGSFSAHAGNSRLVTSAGLDARGGGTMVGWHVTINGEIGDGFSARAPESDADFETRLEGLLATARLLETDASPPEGGLHRVILHPHVVEGYVIETLLHNLKGSTVANGEGHFRREQFGSGQPVVREDLTLRLDPLLPLRRGSYRFTIEGVPAARCTYIEHGQLVRPLLDMKYARRLGLAPTPQPVAMDTLFLEGPPTLPLDEAVELAAGGALVLSVLGAHTQDASSGDFSLSAPQVLAVGRSGFTGKLRGTISGNLFALLGGADLRCVRFEGEHTPGLLVRCRFDPQ